MVRHVVGTVAGIGFLVFGLGRERFASSVFGEEASSFYQAHGALRALVETVPREIKNRTFRNPFPQLGVLNIHD